MSRVYVGRLSYQVREKDVERFFRGIGRIRDINLKDGFGFVEFDDPRDADDAVSECNGRELQGERIIVEHARGSSSGYGGGRYDRGGGGGRGGGGYDRGGGNRYGRQRYGPPNRTEHRIRVENISSRVSWQGLKDFMRQAGEITYADAHKQRVGEGIVECATREDMRSAIKKLDGVDLNGRKLRLIEEHSGSGGGGSSRHRSRSRSRSRDRNRSRSRSSSRSRSRSRDKDRGRSRSHSHSPNNRSAKKRSRSCSASSDRSKSHDHSEGSPAAAGSNPAESNPADSNPADSNPED